MNVSKKGGLATEAEMQINALNTINKWKKPAKLISFIGAGIACAGILGSPVRLFWVIPGILLMLAGSWILVVLNQGLKNGRRNVEKMLHVMEEEIAYTQNLNITVED